MTWLFSHIPVIALSVWGSRHANLPATLLALAISLTIPGMTLGWVPVPFSRQAEPRAPQKHNRPKGAHHET